jgi:hypothetical protein
MRAIISAAVRGMRRADRFLISSALAVPLAVALAAAPAAADVAITIDGNPTTVSPAPIIQAGRVFVPLRGVFEQLGASVVYANREINATGNGHVISLNIGSTQATIDDQPQTIDVAPFIIGASTYVPLRFVSQALGATVNWDQPDQVVMIVTSGGSAAGVDASGDATYADSAPPDIPDYEQPEAPAPNELWQPGYWAYGAYGYFWVPGTWVEAPQDGYLWTPGYWSADNGGYGWHEGFWALAIGFYGGINYGAGYYGNGYDGGRWEGNTFRYNTYVTRVNTTVIHNTYEDRSVTINTTTHVSYNGGSRGVAARPTSAQVAVASQHHLGPTPTQVQHVHAAAQDRQLLARVNNAHPPVVAVARPLTAAARPEGFVPVTAADRVTPARRPAPAYHAPAPAAARPVPVRPAPEAAHPAPAEARPGPAYHAPVRPAEPDAIRPAPAYHAPERPAPAAVHPAPAARPAQPPASVQQAAPQRPKPAATQHPAQPHPAQPHRKPATPHPDTTHDPEPK